MKTNTVLHLQAAVLTGLCVLVAAPDAGAGSPCMTARELRLDSVSRAKALVTDPAPCRVRAVSACVYGLQHDRDLQALRNNRDGYRSSTDLSAAITRVGELARLRRQSENITNHSPRSEARSADVIAADAKKEQAFHDESR